MSVTEQFFSEFRACLGQEAESWARAYFSIELHSDPSKLDMDQFIETYAIRWEECVRADARAASNVAFTSDD